MTELLIVDDEAHVVDRLATTIGWASIGIEQVYQAYSGAEALELLEKLSIDIVITDIHMPGMSGLQLIAVIREKWPKTRSILLSGHSDFSYAKEAILQETGDYLLKPVTERDLLASTKRVLDKLKTEWEDVVSRQRLVYAFNENLPRLRANLLSDLLQGRKLPADSLKSKMESLSLPDYSGNRFAILMARMEGSFLESDWQSLSLAEYAIGKMVEELFGDRYDNWFTKDPHDFLVFVLKPKAEPQDAGDIAWLERTASSLQSAVHQFLGGKISLLVGSFGQFPDDLVSLYDRSLRSFRKRIGNESELLIRLEDEGGKPEISSLLSMYEPPTLLHLLEAARWSEIEEKLQSVFAEVEARHAESPEHLLEVYFAVASAFSYIAHKNGRHLQQVLGAAYDRMSDGERFQTVSRLRDWVIQGLHSIREDMVQETKDSRAAVIRDIRSYIDQHLGGDVTLQTIADYVHLHPVYVSQIYKLETGENISDYVQRVRMENAEYLLKHTQDKVYEIAARLGYQRPHSFNYAFKKQFGMTPQEYREQFL